MATHGKPPKVPKGYRPLHTSFRLTTETYFEKPYKPLKPVKNRATKEYVQPVRIVKAKALGGKRNRG